MIIAIRKDNDKTSWRLSTCIHLAVWLLIWPLTRHRLREFEGRLSDVVRALNRFDAIANPRRSQKMIVTRNRMTNRERRFERVVLT